MRTDRSQGPPSRPALSARGSQAPAYPKPSWQPRSPKLLSTPYLLRRGPSVPRAGPLTGVLCPPNPNQAESKFGARATCVPSLRFTTSPSLFPIWSLRREEGPSELRLQGRGPQQTLRVGEARNPMRTPPALCLSYGWREPEKTSASPRHHPRILTSFLPVQGTLVSNQPIPRPCHRLCPPPEFR